MYIVLILSYTCLLLTPWSRVLLEKLTSSHLLKKFPAFYGTRRFVTTFTSVHHLSLSWASLIQSIPPHRNIVKYLKINQHQSSSESCSRMKYEYGAIVEWYWQEKTKVPGEEPVPVPETHWLTWIETRTSIALNSTAYAKAWFSYVMKWCFCCHTGEETQCHVRYTTQIPSKTLDVAFSRE